MNARSLLVILLLPAAPIGAVAQDGNIHLPADSVERLLTTAPFEPPAELRALNRRTSIGILTFADGTQLPVKWAPAPRGGERFNNVPRYELAAYALQTLFLDPSAYVVPPLGLRVVPLTTARRLDGDTQQPFGQAESALVLVQYFLSNVTSADVFDAERFDADPYYERLWGNANLLTYLIAHNDANQGNLLISKDPASPRVFAVDNGIAFRSEPPDRPGRWRDLLVDRFPADAVSRLGRLDRATLVERLGVLAQFEVRDGQFVEVTPGTNLDPGRGVRTEGSVVQLGLTDGEIDDVWDRLQRFLRRFPAGSDPRS